MNRSTGTVVSIFLVHVICLPLSICSQCVRNFIAPSSTVSVSKGAPFTKWKARYEENECTALVRVHTTAVDKKGMLMRERWRRAIIVK